MKNVFLMLAFMLVGGFAFASNGVVELKEDGILKCTSTTTSTTSLDSAGNSTTTTVTVTKCDSPEEQAAFVAALHDQ